MRSSADGATLAELFEATEEGSPCLTLVVRSPTPPYPMCEDMASAYDRAEEPSTLGRRPVPPIGGSRRTSSRQDKRTFVAPGYIHAAPESFVAA